MTDRPDERIPVGYEILGTTFQVASPPPEVGAELRRLLCLFESPGARVPEERHFLVVFDQTSGLYRLYRHCEPLDSSVDWRALVSRLVAELNAATIDGFAGFAAHAGVVAHENTAVACLAASGTGKSTMVAASLPHGFRYVSDEALCVRFGSRSVVPYPKPIQLSAPSRQVLGLSGPGDFGAEALLSPAALGGEVASPPLELAHLVRLVRRPGDAELLAAPSSGGVEWLLERSFNHYKRPKETFLLVSELASRCRSWVLEYQDAPQAAPLLAQLVSPSGRPPNEAFRPAS